MIVYIKNTSPKKFIQLDKELDKNSYSNIGYTYEDYEKGAWVKLSDEQVQFHLNHPNASVEEVWDMTIYDPVIPVIDGLEQAKNDMLNTIDMYDKSTAVNGFIVNGTITTWFTVEQRLNYKQSVEAAKLLGEDTLMFLVEGQVFSVSVTAAEYMLAQIQRYADACYMVTEAHKHNVRNLDTINEVRSYDFMKGYPEQLKFTLT